MSFLCVIVVTGCKELITFSSCIQFPTFSTLSPFEPQRKSNLHSLFSMSREIADRIIPSKIQQKFAT